MTSYQPYLPNLYTEVRLSWVASSSANVSFSPDSGGYGIFVAPQGNTISLYLNNNGDGQCYNFGSSSQHVLSHTLGISPRLFLSSYPVTYPSGYEGLYLPAPNLSLDYDADNLVAAYEDTQGTSDIDSDSDNDGIDDFKESVWFADRDSVFCGSQCAYPNPTKKDVYVEVDWMKNGTDEFKPTGNQIDLIVDAFEDKDINLHVDTGQYGGGNDAIYEEELPFMPTIGQTDLYDIKNGNGSITANFSQNRKDIWRYMLTGDKRDTSSTGAALAGNDDIFIAIGRVRDLYPSGQDQAIAGTMIHELGHSLCLSNDNGYAGQDPSCIFASIDTSASADYVSAMNYYYQFSLVGYSNGLNGANDHDDWSAILVGMDDFVGKEDPVESFSRMDRMEQQPED